MATRHRTTRPGSSSGRWVVASANAAPFFIGRRTQALRGDFLNDWAVIFQVLAHPHLPLTNKYAERLLSHGVILRRIGHGTRTEQGSLALATFSSLVETCRLRNASPCATCIR